VFDGLADARSQAADGATKGDDQQGHFSVGGVRAMRSASCVCATDAVASGVEAESNEIVMGLHWDSPQDGAAAVAANLDAVCVLFDRHGEVIELIHPRHPRGADDSVVHTGDSRSGRSAWDDVRIFVFLDALPVTVSSLAFVVMVASGRGFQEACGAYGHVSDPLSEREMVRVELAPRCGCSIVPLALVRRSEAGWRVGADAQSVRGDLLERVRLQLCPGSGEAAAELRLV
jgi:tellurium resistance protein TerZ